MVPSESALETAVDALDAAQFQHLAEAYLAIESPAVFGRPLIYGRNSSGSTTAGWPDAYALLEDQKIFVLEASRQAGAWTRHVDADLRKAAALPRGTLGGFAFVSWARTPRPTTLLPRQQHLVDMGVPLKRQIFVFRQQLVADLCHGRFAAIWASLLGLSVSAYPFSGLREARIYGSGASGQFMPTIEEYEQGLVPDAPITSQLQGRIRKEGFAMVQGRGASGKTALAANLGWRRLREGHPVYYLDLADPAAAGVDFVRAAEEAIVVRADKGVLFIIDNVHQNASTAAELHLTWRASSVAGDLLLLGRLAESAESARGILSPLADLAEESFELRVSRRMLAGVYDRLRRRDGRAAIEIPTEVRKRWLNIFGGDLIAFGAALTSSDVGPPNWQLSPMDARHYLHDRYLDGLDPVAQRDLCLVADRSALELPTSEKLLTPGSLTRALANGILERRGGMIQTVHPGMGELILAAAGVSIGDFAGQIDLGELPSAAMALTARRLMRRGETDAAAMQVRRLVALGIPTFELVANLGSGSMGVRIRLLEELLGSHRTRELLHDEDELKRFVSNGALGELFAFRRVSQSIGGGLQASFVRAFKREFRAGSLDLDRFALEAAAELKTLPLVLRHAERLSAEFHRSLVPLLAESGALSACIKGSPGFQKRRWADLIHAAEVSPQALDAIASELISNPENSTRLLLYRGKGPERLDSAARLPTLQQTLISVVRSAEFRRTIESELPTYGSRKFCGAIRIVESWNPRFLSRLDQLALDGNMRLNKTVVRRLGPKAWLRMLNATEECCPALHTSLLGQAPSDLSD